MTSATGQAAEVIVSSTCTGQSVTVDAVDQADVDDGHRDLRIDDSVQGVLDGLAQRLRARVGIRAVCGSAVTVFLQVRSIARAAALNGGSDRTPASKFRLRAMSASV